MFAPRRAVLVYLLAIVGPTLALLYLALQSIERQREAIASLRASNERLATENLATEVERRTRILAGACLKDQETVLQQTALPSSAAGTRQLRARLDAIRQRRQIARYFFVVEGGEVRFPLLREFPETDTAFESAEEIEFGQHHPEQALQLYRRAYEAPLPDETKALTLAHAARCLRKLKRFGQAQEAYRVLGERFGDCYDPFHRPYALISAFEIEPGDAELLVRLYRDFARGRWEVSAEQAEYYLSRFQERLGPAVATGEEDYLGSLQFARDLEDGFNHQGPVRIGELYSYRFVRQENTYETWYAALRQSDGQEILFGFAADLNWLKNHLVPEAQSTLGVPIHPRVDSRRDLWVFGATAVLIVGTLLLGVILLLRDVWRDMQLNRIRSDFVSGVSHDMKTPLSGIRLYAEDLRDTEGLSEEERRKSYHAIIRHSERLTRLIENVLNFARMDSGRMAFHLEKGDLAEVIAGAAEASTRLLQQNGFKVETNFAAALPQVRMDADAVAQAVWNLIDNAVKYSGESRFLGLRLWSESFSVIFEVEDRGIGIPREEQGRVFDQFHRVRNNSGKGGYYGLGLFLVRKIMAVHGGAVELDSEPGRGSRFRLIFPV